MSFESGYALLIGDGQTALIAAALQDQAAAGYPSGRVQLVTEPTAALAALGALAGKLGTSDTLLLYISTGIAALGAPAFLSILQSLNCGRALICFDGPGCPTDLAAATLATRPGLALVCATGGSTPMMAVPLAQALGGEGVSSNAGYIDAFDLYLSLNSSLNPPPTLSILADTGSFPVALCRGATTRGEFRPLPSPAIPELRKVRPTEARHQLKALLGTSTTLTNPAPPSPPRGQVFGDQRNVSANQYSEQLNDQRIYAGTVNIGGATERELIPVTPPPPPHYVKRTGPEDDLKTALLADDSTHPAVFLWGGSGTGKSTLALAVAHDLQAQGVFPGGVLWADTAGSTPDELLRTLFAAIGRQDLSTTTGHTGAAMLWQLLGERSGDDRRQAGERRTLVVIDNMDDLARLLQLLPTSPTRNRLLTISQENPTARVKLATGQSIRVGSFLETESITLFQRMLGDDMARAHRAPLTEIAQLVDHLPALIYGAAAQIAERSTTPQAYLRRLRSLGDGAVLPDPAWQTLELAVRDLEPSAAELFALMGLFGEGDWSAEMLGAVALLPPEEVRRRIEPLIRRVLVELSGARYRLKANQQRIARRRLEELPTYQRTSAWHLLARYCLDLAQDQAIDADTRRQIVEQPADAYTLVIDHRNMLTGEMSHFRRVLDWAATNEVWNLVRRFADLPFVGLVVPHTANPRTVYLDGYLTTITRLITGLAHPAHQPLTFISGGGSLGWQGQAADDQTIAVTAGTDLRKIEQILDGAGQACELFLRLTASEILNACLSDADLIDVALTGVRARGSIWRRLSMAGARLIACDLVESVWEDCEAIRASFASSNLAGAVLRRVKLRGADLRGVNLSGAVLCEVDLRGTDLSGANLSGARLRGVNLLGARLDDVQWVGINGTFTLDEDYILAPTTVASQPFQPHYTFQIGLEQTRDFRLSYSRGSVDFRTVQIESLSLDNCQFEMAGFQAATISDVSMNRCSLSGADLRGARLTRVDLRDVILTNSDLRGAAFADAKFEAVHLDGARLRYALFANTTLHTCELTGADLYAASLTGLSAVDCIFNQADLRATDLSGATLSGAQLNQTRLCGANLLRSTLARALLREADLSWAILSGANLSGADLSGANLSDADLTGASFEGATVSDESLAEAATLRNAVLPDGLVVLRLDGRDGLRPGMCLRFAEIQGSFVGADLAGYDMTGAHIQADMSDANLRGATLRLARLQGHFRATDLCNTNLTGSTLEGEFEQANFNGAVLFEASLRGQFNGAQFIQAHLTSNNWYKHSGDLDLHNAVLTNNTFGSMYGDINLSGARLTANTLSGDFGDIDLSGATLTGDTMSGRLGDINLRAAILTDNTLSGRFGDINLSGARLTSNFFSGDFGDIDLSGATLTVDTFSGDFGDINLSGATLTSVNFSGDFGVVDLRGARFNGITFIGSATNIFIDEDHGRPKPDAAPEADNSEASVAES